MDKYGIMDLMSEKTDRWCLLARDLLHEHALGSGSVINGIVTLWYAVLVPSTSATRYGCRSWFYWTMVIMQARIPT